MVLFWIRILLIILPAPDLTLKLGYVSMYAVCTVQIKSLHYILAEIYVKLFFKGVLLRTPMKIIM
jgi:hypothetical protein